LGTTRRSALLIAFEFVPVFLFRPNTYAGTCMSIEHIYMRPSRLKRYIQSNPVHTTPTGNTP